MALIKFVVEDMIPHDTKILRILYDENDPNRECIQFKFDEDEESFDDEMEAKGCITDIEEKYVATWAESKLERKGVKL